MKTSHLFENQLEEKIKKAKKWMESVKEFMHINSKIKYEIKIENDLPTFYVDSNITIVKKFLNIGNGYYELPFPFGDVAGDFTVLSHDEMLGTFNYFPVTIGGTCDVSRCRISEFGRINSVGELNVSFCPIASWKGLPSQIGTLNVVGTKIKSFSGISKELIRCSLLIFNPIEITSGALDLLAVDELEEVKADLNTFSATKSIFKRAEKLEEIINEHLASGKRDIFAMQADLIDNDLETWATR